MQKSNMILVALSCCSSTAIAQTPTLSKADLEALFVGKTVHSVRTNDGVRVTTNVMANGWMLTQSSTGGKGKMRWSIDDTGKFCWQSQGATAPDGCRVYIKAGDQLQVFDPTNMTQPVGMIEKIE